MIASAAKKIRSRPIENIPIKTMTITGERINAPVPKSLLDSVTPNIVTSNTIPPFHSCGASFTLPNYGTLRLSNFPRRRDLGLTVCTICSRTAVLFLASRLCSLLRSLPGRLALQLLPGRLLLLRFALLRCQPQNPFLLPELHIRSTGHVPGKLCSCKPGSAGRTCGALVFAYPSFPFPSLPGKLKDAHEPPR